MADKPNKPRAKRLVKNPETFRERALKAGENAGTPDRASKVKRTGGAVVRPIAKPVKQVAGSKPFKPIAAVMRVIGKVLLPAYIRNSWRELRKVTWPSWKQSRQLTFAVLVFAIIFGALIAAVDYGLDKLFRNILLK